MTETIHQTNNQAARVYLRSEQPLGFNHKPYYESHEEYNNYEAFSIHVCLFINLNFTDCLLCQVSVEELKTLLGRYANTDELAMNGVTVGGTKYMFLSATDRVVRGKKGTSGVHCIKTVQGEQQ